MIPAHQCEDISDTIPLFPVKGLFFKPISRINVSVHYPQLKQSLPTGGKTVSSWEIMEKLKSLLAPDKFISIRVVKNTLEFIRFEGDLENRSVMKIIMARLEGKSMKITGFKEPMKIRVAEAKIPFPTKYDWDSFFRDAKNMNEMKAGERPDTIHLQNLPCKWFSDHPNDEKPIPSEKLFRRIWEKYGDIRSIDIPVADPYRIQMQPSIAGIKTFTFSSDAVFEAYVQYRDYMCFVRAMDALRGSYILFQESSKYWVANVKVDFDKSKHLGEESIRRRRQERERLMELEKKEKMTAALSKLEEKERSRKQIEEEKKETDKNQAQLDYKIAMEERKYIIARRKLEAIRLMDYLFERLKKRVEEPKRTKASSQENNSDLHEKIIGKYKRLQQSRVEEQHLKLKEFRESRRHRSSHQEDRDSFGKGRNYSRSRSRSRERERSRSRSRSRTESVSRGRSRSRSRERPRSRSMSYKSRSRSRSAHRSRSRSRSARRSRSRTGSRSIRRSRSRSRSVSRRSRSGSRSARRSRSGSRSRDNYGSSRDNERYRHYDTRATYDKDRNRYHDQHRHYDERDKREFHHEDDRYRRNHEHDGHDRGRGFHHGGRPPRGGPFVHDGAPRPYRGRGGRGSFPSRYIGDWEVRERENFHNAYPPAPIPMPMPPMPYPNGPGLYQQPPPPDFYRGRGRGYFRGRGRGFRGGHPHYQNQNHDSFDENNGQVVRRDYTYLEELDRAYEKYFKRITDKKE